MVPLSYRINLVTHYFNKFLLGLEIYNKPKRNTISDMVGFWGFRSFCFNFITGGRLFFWLLFYWRFVYSMVAGGLFISLCWWGRVFSWDEQVFWRLGMFLHFTFYIGLYQFIDEE